jgi:hypothetical protein
MDNFRDLVESIYVNESAFDECVLRELFAFRGCISIFPRDGGGMHLMTHSSLVNVRISTIVALRYEVEATETALFGTPGNSFLLLIEE